MDFKDQNGGEEEPVRSNMRGKMRGWRGSRLEVNLRHAKFKVLALGVRF